VIEVGRFKRAKGETYHTKGQKVWLNKKNWTVTVRPQRRKSFGEVAKDSLWPDLWVSINIWNWKELQDYDQRNIPPWILKAQKLKTARYLNRVKVRRGPRV
jgi:hypothetical protein